MMNTDKDERVRLRAYDIWREQGQPQGRDVEHWQQAEREVEADKTTDYQPKTAGSGSSSPELSSGKRQKANKTAGARSAKKPAGVAAAPRRKPKQTKS